MPGFEYWLASWRRALVIVPLARWQSVAVREQFRSGNPTELIALREVLSVEDGEFRLNWSYEPDVTANDLISGNESYPTFCATFDNDGRRMLTAPEYRERVGRGAEFDLFIDLMTTVDGRGFRAGRRNLELVYEETTLTKLEAAVLVEIITTARALRAGDFTTINASSTDKIIERARRKVDVRLGRYDWRAIHTVSTSTQEGKRWQFLPHDGMKWCVLFPAD
jgi:hypothetical protein